MKKILSLTLAVMLLVSAIPTAYAADQDYSLGTAVTVEGAGGEYTVTVPATLNAGEVGTVTAKGYWASGETLKVTAPETIEVTNTKTSQKATVNVSFDGIESLGNDLEEMNVPVSISVDKGNTKFGTWTGTIVYNVELDDGRPNIFYEKEYIYETSVTTTTLIFHENNTATLLHGESNDGTFSYTVEGKSITFATSGTASMSGTFSDDGYTYTSRGAGTFIYTPSASE